MLQRLSVSQAYKKARCAHVSGPAGECSYTGEGQKRLCSWASKGCRPCLFCAWESTPFSFSHSVHSHWPPPVAFFQPLLSGRDPGCSSLFLLIACLLGEILGHVSLTSMLLLPHGLCTLHKFFHVFCVHSSISSPARSDSSHTDTHMHP